jgi:hypothetical protein
VTAQPAASAKRFGEKRRGLAQALDLQGTKPGLIGPGFSFVLRLAERAASFNPSSTMNCLCCSNGVRKP